MNIPIYCYIPVKSRKLRRGCWGCLPCAAAFGWPGLVYPAIKVPCLGPHVSYKTGQLIRDSCATAKHTSPVSH